MFKSFEVKSYNQLRFYLGLANSVGAFLLLLLAYSFVLTPDHTETILRALEKLRAHPFLSAVPASLVLSGFWGWFSTIVLRLHDRVHEPWIRKWRASYDADFILRGLCYDQSNNVSSDLFERAYTDKRVCRKLMQRLFYNFAGDSTCTREGSRAFFYTVMWKYWFAALCDLYSVSGIVLFGAYHIWSGSRMSAGLVFGLCLVQLVCRIFSNRFLDEAHEITLSQIHGVRTEKDEEFQNELEKVGKELSAWRNHT